MVDTISIVPQRSIAAITAFDIDQVRDALHAQFGTAPPDGPAWVEADGTRLSRLAPARFLVQGDRHTNLPARLSTLFGDIAAVTDQSDLWHAVAMSGPTASERLARIVPVDLHRSVFLVGDLALTRGFHIDIRLWRLGDEDWELAVTRSHAAHLAHALS